MSKANWTPFIDPKNNVMGRIAVYGGKNLPFWVKILGKNLPFWVVNECLSCPIGSLYEVIRVKSTIDDILGLDTIIWPIKQCYG
jgi:hypothetical protein